MSATSNPRVSIALLAAQLAQTIKGRRDLICGAFPGYASAVDGQLYTDVGKFTKTQLDDLFGANSDIRNRIDQFLKANGGYSQLDVKAVLSTATDNASYTIDFGATTATAEGTYTVSMADETQFTYSVDVAIGDTAAEVAANMFSAIFDSPNTKNPFTSAASGVVGNTLVLEGNDRGELTNKYRVKVVGNVAGIGSPSVTQTTASDVETVTTFFDDLQSTRYTGVLWPTEWIPQISILKDYLDPRFNAANAILDGVGFIGLSGTFAEVKAVVDAQNSQSVSFGGYTKDVIFPADWAMAYFAGIRARRLTIDAPIADQIVSTSGVLDAFGGPALASLPYFNTPMNSMPITDPNLLYSNQEQVELEDAGFSVFGVNSSENGMITGPMVTTYTTDGAGNPNDSFHFLNYVDTASICREYFFNNLKARFSQSRLTNGSLVPGRSIENEESIRAEFSKIYKELSILSLTVAGAEAEKFFKQYLSVTLDLANRKVTATFQLPIVTQLGEMIVTAQLNFNFQEA